MISLRFGDSRRNDSNSNFGNEFDGDSGSRIGAFEVVDELLEILDRVDVVMRRRGDETDSGSRMSSSRDQLGNLLSRKLSSFSGLRTLRHLDLKLVGVGQVIARDSESTGGDLLDRASLSRIVRRGISSFSGVGFTALRDTRASARCTAAME